ncbi:hypothetical protein NQ317_017503 [Molorchus minor]|uniref:Uncharacterized protein n=1 Tax=Molorchus minor TaxID=1323400 RepID=A0ABQ9JRJ1_9CUCU|nr:hypothetical protein NQ317_017503 [Molorchus minor]
MLTVDTWQRIFGTGKYSGEKWISLVIQCKFIIGLSPHCALRDGLMLNFAGVCIVRGVSNFTHKACYVKTRKNNLVKKFYHAIHLRRDENTGIQFFETNPPK